MDKNNLYGLVNDRYGQIAKQTDHDRDYTDKVATAFGYSKEDILSIPVSSNLGLGCGNPLAMATIKEGETVVDFGSGAGFDAFLAAKKVGPTGKVIGIDMNIDMLSKARQNAQKLEMSYVSFLEGRITSVPLPDATADYVISNCVINLVPESDKRLVFEEAFRILKPGGRLAVSDILAKIDMPSSMKASMALYVGCISNASLVREYEKYMKDAGFKDCLILDAKSDLNVYATGETNGGCCEQVKDVEPCCNGGSCTSAGCAGCCDKVEDKGSCCSSSTAPKLVQPSDIDFNEWAGSYKIFAVKPHTGE